jgi:predicted acyltransferase
LLRFARAWFLPRTVFMPDTAPEATPTARLESLDALRGFDMFWIMGADAFGGALAKAAGLGSEHAPASLGGKLFHWFAEQMEHVPWEGFHFYDLIFPLFVFIAGVSGVFSLGKTVEAKGKDAAFVRLFQRSFLLYLLGIFYYGGVGGGWEMVRYVGVLQRIALCYFFAGFLFIYFRPRTLLIVLGALLLGYWALLALVPVPGVGAGNFEEGKNLTNWLDKVLLPGRRWDGDHDPEGLLSTLPAIGSCLLGIFAGLLLQDETKTPPRKAALLAGAGLALLAAGHLWGLGFPIIKKLWTSSYVLVAGGWSALLLAAFYYVIDIRGWRRWCRPFVWIGLNAITVYLASNLISFSALTQRFTGLLATAGQPAYGLNAWLDAWHPGGAETLVALLSVLWLVVLAWAMHRRRLYLRL